ncbi:hypothetical protein PVAND_003398 [Polypedilum vanderplanki]|uniref:Odorant receptor n=1 Tax=Polypedilum vanderplanki TaxID=319348 RepID=A0A9J6BUZ6_POLVA|nr:hypothetical protein PVAND_003398 [Polypedilum vanderplanki]
MLLNREPYKTAFKVFTFLGFWDEISIVQRRWTFKLPIFLIFVLVLMAFTSFFQARDFHDALISLATLPILTVIIFSIFDFLYKKEQLKKFLVLVDEIESENPDVSVYIDKACKLNTLIYLVVLVVLILTYLTYAIIPLIIHKLTFPIYLHEKFDDSFLVFYGIWFIQTLIGMYSTLTLYIFFEFRNSLLVLITHIMRYYRYKLSNLSSIIVDQKARMELIKCIKLHLQIKELIKLFMEVFSVALYVLLTMNALTIVSVVYVLINSSHGNQAFVLCLAATSLCHIFIPCIHGSNIESESEKLSYSLFSSDWTNSDIKYQKMMIIVMENLKQSLRLRAFGLSEINLEFFVQTLNTAYSMYAVLNSISS